MTHSLKSLLSTLKWLATTLAAVAAQQPQAFVAGVAFEGLSKIFHVLAFVLPLKVILLAGNDGVPSYTPFIAEDDKLIWIYGLAAASILSYGLTLLLDAASSRSASKAGGAIAGRAANLAIVSNQTTEAQNIVSHLVAIASAIVFYIVGLFVLALLDPRTFVTMSVLTVLSALVAGALITTPRHPLLAPAQRFIAERTDTYIAVNSSAIFLASFVVILYPFLQGLPVNVLAAVISIIVLRRALGVAFSSVNDTLKLVHKRHLVDALMFRDRQLTPRVEPARTTFAQAFSRKERRVAVKQAIEKRFPHLVVRRLDWADPSFGGIFQFDILEPKTPDSRHVLQIIEPKRLHLIENERRLFEHVPREQLSAPAELGDLSISGFDCRVLAAAGDSPRIGEWRTLLPQTLGRIAAVEPPKSLLEVYRSTHPLLHERLTDTMVRSVETAISTPEQGREFKAFRNRLPEIRGILSRLPLYVSNPDLKMQAARLNRDGQLTFLNWGRWTLEPLGAGILAYVSAADFEQVVSHVAATRSEYAGASLLADARLARDVAIIVLNIDRGSYGAALSAMREMLSGKDVMQDSEDESDASAEGVPDRVEQ